MEQSPTLVTVVTVVAVRQRARSGTKRTGGDFYTRLNPDKAKNRAVDQLRKMGYDVTLNPLADAG